MILLPVHSRAALLVVVGLLGAVVCVPTASAHQPDPSVVTVLDAVQPALPSTVRLEVARSVADQLVVTNTSAETLEVLADSGEAFLRVGPGGVQADLASPTWYATSSPLGVLPPGAPRQPGRPRLATVAAEPSWGWFDHRLHPAAPQLSEAVRRGRSTVRLAEWTVPMRYAGRPLTVRGHLEFRPVVGALRTRVTSGSLPQGFTVQVLEGRVPGLFARYVGPGTLEIKGRDAEPFARLSAAGATVNVHSATYVADQLLRGTAPAGREESEGAPRWRRVSAAPSLAWLDERLAYRRGDVPTDVLARAQASTLVRWRVELTGPAGADAVEGITEWVPATGARAADRRRWPLVAAGVVVVALLAAAAAVRWRLRA